MWGKQGTHAAVGGIGVKVRYKALVEARKGLQVHL